jgi:hypothetical protein
MSARTWEERGEPADRPADGARRDRRRRGQPVHRRSKPTGFAASFSRKFPGGSREERAKILKRMLDAASFYADRLPREARAAYGEITGKMLRVYRELVIWWVKSADGLVEPSGAELAYKSRCGEATVWRALDALERHGFIRRLRRFRPARSGEAGRWEQDKNAYRILTPDPAGELVDAPHVGLDPKRLPPRKPRPPRRPPRLDQLMGPLAAAAGLPAGAILAALAALAESALAAPPPGDAESLTMIKTT